MSRPSVHFDPRHFYDLARKLLNDSDYAEASRVRTAVSRAYYAAFLAARGRLETLNLRPNRRQVHKEVHEAVKSKDAKLAQKLSTLRRHRNEADYDLESAITIDAGRSYIEICRIILEPLSKLFLSQEEIDSLQQKFECQLKAPLS